jgi:hypothetical protein
MPRTKNKLGITSVAHSLFVGAGSILGFFGGDMTTTSHIPMARQDRDARSLQSDWQRVGKDIRNSMESERRNKTLSKKR